MLIWKKDIGNQILFLLILVSIMASRVDSISNVLGVDRIDMRGKMILIEELHGSDGNFLLSSIISNSIKKDHGICVVLFHNTFNHYHNVGMKMGYNLMTLKEKGRLAVVDPMNTILSEVELLCEDKLDINDSVLVKRDTKVNTRIVYQLFSIVRGKCHELLEDNDSVLIIVDDLASLCDMGLNLTDCMLYVRYLRSLVNAKPSSQLCVLTHTYQNDAQICVPNALANGLKYMAHLIVIVEPLKTGYSSDASGKITVTWRIHSVRREYHWPENCIYLYKLMDRQVKIYAPGTEANLL